MLSTVVSLSTPKRLQISSTRSGRNVPSVSGFFHQQCVVKSFCPTALTKDCNLAFSSTSLFRQLCHDCQGVTQLCFSTAELSVDLIDTARLEPTLEESVPGLAPSRDPVAASPKNGQLSQGHESICRWLARKSDQDCGYR